MKRSLLKNLVEWKNSPRRKPLILKGVRQVGKTWLLKEFGRLYYENVAYFNFDENEEDARFDVVSDDRIIDGVFAEYYKLLDEQEAGETPELPEQKH